MKKTIIGLFLLAFPLGVFAQTVDRGDLNLILDDCGGVVKSNCIPWSVSEKGILLNFLYGVGKNAPDNTLTGAYQFIRVVVGLPYQSGRTVKITHDSTSPNNAYYAGDRIVIKGLDISGIEAGDARKKTLKLLAHELMHAFQGPAIPQSAFAEGLGRMTEKLVESKFNLVDPSIGPDFHFTNYDQNNNLAKGPANGNIPFEILGLAGDTYSLIGAAFTKLYLENPTVWSRFHDELYKKLVTDTAYENSAVNLLALLKNVSPAQIEGFDKEGWFSKQAAFAYNQSAGPVLAIAVDRNAFLYVQYFYRGADGRVRQQLPDGRTLTGSTLSDVEVTVRYYDVYGNVIGSGVAPFSSWAGLTDTNNIWISLAPLDRPYAVKAVAEFKIKSTGAVLTKEVWLATQGAWHGIPGIVSSTFKNEPDEGKVVVMSLNDPSISYTLPVSKGTFYAAGSADAASLEKLEGPILVSYFDAGGQKIKERKVNKLSGNLTVLLDAQGTVVIPRPVSNIEQLQSQLQALQNQLVTLQNQQSSLEQTPNQVEPPSLAFNAVFSQVDVNMEIYTLSWGSVGADSCRASWKNSNVPVTGFENVGVPNDRAVKFTLTCTGVGGSVSKTVSVGGTGQTSTVPTTTQVRPISTPTVTTLIATATSTPDTTTASISSPATTPTSAPTNTAPTQTSATATSATPSVSTAIFAPAVLGKPDLLIYEFSLSPKKETYYKSEPFALNYVLKNIGQKESGQFKLSLKNKTNGWDLGGGGFNGLAAGSSIDQTSSWNTLFWASEGYNLMELKVDGDNMVDESSKDNNTTTFGILVSAGMPPTTVTTTASSVAPTSVTQSQTTTSSALSSTLGSSSSTNVSLSSTTATATSTATTTSSTTTQPTSGSSSASSGATTTTTPVASKFTISTPPNLTAGQTYNISWQMTQGSASTVRLSLYQNGSFKDFIIADTANNGSYQWVVPNSVGSNYSIRIVDIAYPNDYADSGMFSIVSGATSYSAGNSLASVLDLAQSIIDSIAQKIKELGK